MRVVTAAIAAAAVLAACASPSNDTDPEQPSPFPVERGAALPPPAQSSTQPPPPEGPGPAGVDFGRWRSADPVAYAPAFQTQMRARLAGKTEAEMRADLAANGFACEGGARLDCRIEIMERGCAFDWYVVAAREDLAAGFDVMCLGARSDR